MLNGMTYNELATACHENNKKWWMDLNTGERIDRNKGELIMLMVSEIAEAMEGERKGGLMDDKLPHRKMAEVELVDAIIRIGDFAGGFGIDLDTAVASFDPPTAADIAAFPTNKGEGLLFIVHILVDAYETTLDEFHGIGDIDVGQQLAGALMTIRIYADIHGYDLDGAYVEKTAFNKVRKDHTIEARKAEGGKKF